MNIVNAGALTAMSTIARLFAGLVLIKLAAFFGGPEGVGKIGQLTSLAGFLAILASGGIGTGIVKYIAEYRSDMEKLQRLMGTGVYCALAASCVVCFMTFVFSKSLANWLLGDSRYCSLIWILAASLPAIVASNFIVAVINGFMDVRRITVLYIAGAVLSIAAAIALAYFFQLYGAMTALVLGQAATLFVSLPLLLDSSYFNRRFFRPFFDRDMTVRLTRFSVMTLTSALLPPLVNIWVRNHLAAQLSWQDAGYWQAVSKVSEAYLLFFTSAISVYYLPKLSAISERNSLKAELRSAFVFVLPAVIVSAILVYLFRDLLTKILFNDQFGGAVPLYGPQLVGDVIKIASFVFSYIMLAKAMTKVFLVSELVFSATYVALVYVLTWQFGLVGAMYAFAANYSLYFIFTAIVARTYVRRM